MLKSILRVKLWLPNNFYFVSCLQLLQNVSNEIFWRVQRVQRNARMKIIRRRQINPKAIHLTMTTAKRLNYSHFMYFNEFCKCEVYPYHNIWVIHTLFILRSFKTSKMCTTLVRSCNLIYTYISHFQCFFYIYIYLQHTL